MPTPDDVLELFRPNSPLVDAIADERVIGLNPLRDPTGPASSAERLQTNRNAVARILNLCYWASLAHEEGRPVLSRLTFASPDRISNQFILDRPLPLNHETLVRLGTVAGQEHKLAVHDQDGMPFVWGVLKGFAPGRVTVTFDRPGRIAAIVERAGLLCLFEHGRLHRPGNHLIANPWNLIVQVRRAVGTLFDEARCRVLVDIANEICRNGHGGALLVVDPRSTDWTHQIDLSYPFTEGSRSTLLDSLEVVPQIQDDMLRDALQSEARLAVRQVADLSKVDGATVIGGDLQVFGFGAKIRSTESHPTVRTRTIHEDHLTSTPWTDLGGTRHQSTARFVAQTKTSVAFVASHDGKLGLMSWKADVDGGHVEWLSRLDDLLIADWNGGKSP